MHMMKFCCQNTRELYCQNISNNNEIICNLMIQEEFYIAVLSDEHLRTNLCSVKHERTSSVYKARLYPYSNALTAK